MLLVLVGIAGLLVTGYVATRLAVKYLGAGAAAFLRGGRRLHGPGGLVPGRRPGPDGGLSGPGRGCAPGLGPGSSSGAGPPDPPAGDDRF